MKRFVNNLVLFLMIQMVLWAGLLLVYARCRPFGRHFLAASINKEILLRQQVSPRLIFVGGSNLALGLNGEELQRRTGYHPVNMGLHAGLGLEFMLSQVKESVREGDVIVVSPEYELFGPSYTGAGEIIYTALEQHPSDIRFLSLQNVRPLLDDGYVVASGIIDFDIRCITGRRDPSDVDDPNNVYKRDAFDEYGDLIAHLRQPSVATRNIAPANLGKITGQSISRTIAALNSFGDFCRQKGVTLVYSYPAITDVYLEKNRKEISDISNAINQSLSFATLEKPEDLAFPVDDFFDTYYHLNAIGVEKRTTHFVEAFARRGIKPAAERPQK